MRLGTAVYPSPLVNLMTRNSSSNASIVANVGDGLLRRWILVFDYPHQMLDLRPGGDRAAGAFRNCSGLILTTKGGALVTPTETLHVPPAA
jgi:hypothetical protein